MVVLLAFAFQNRQFKPTKPGCGGIISHLLLPPDMHKARCCTLQKNCQIARVLNANAHIAQQWDHKFCATLLPRYRNWPRTWKTIGEEVSFLSCKLFSAHWKKAYTTQLWSVVWNSQIQPSIECKHLREIVHTNFKYLFAHTHTNKEIGVEANKKPHTQ